MNIADVNDTAAIVQEITRTTEALGIAGDTFAIGNLILLIGGGLIIYAFHWGRFRKRWFFWSTFALALLHIWHPFIGSTFGVILLWCLLWARCEFFAQKAILVAE